MGLRDRFTYGDLEDFEVAHVPSDFIIKEKREAFIFYQKIRLVRESSDHPSVSFESLMEEYNKRFSKYWLAGVELLELAYIFKKPMKEKQLLTQQLISLSNNNSKNEKRPFIQNAIQLIQKEHQVK